MARRSTQLQSREPEFELMELPRPPLTELYKLLAQHPTLRTTDEGRAIVSLPEERKRSRATEALVVAAGTGATAFEETSPPAQKMSRAQAEEPVDASELAVLCNNESRWFLSLMLLHIIIIVESHAFLPHHCICYVHSLSSRGER